MPSRNGRSAPSADSIPPSGRHRSLALREFAAYVRLELRRALEHPTDESTRLEDVAWVLPPNLVAERVTVAVEFVPHGLRFCDPRRNEPALELPRTKESAGRQRRVEPRRQTR